PELLVEPVGPVFVAPPLALLTEFEEVLEAFEPTGCVAPDPHPVSIIPDASTIDDAAVKCLYGFIIVSPLMRGLLVSETFSYQLDGSRGELVTIYSINSKSKCFLQRLTGVWGIPWLYVNL
ncbi:MAG: hypothetical protein JWN30_1102, partial [Bacilli bacterium]|nr:hypothetical protein [Bacilli bacterium]